MSDPILAEIDSYVRRFRQSLAALPDTVREDYADAVRSRLELVYALGRADQEEEPGFSEEEYAAGFVAELKATRPFTLTGLSSRGGLSNWVFFFLPREIIMLDLGVAPAIAAGARAGLSAQPLLALLERLGRSKFGPQQGVGEELEAWQTKLRSRARKVEVLRDDQIGRVRLHMRALAHQIVIEGIGASKWAFQLMNRDEAETVMEPLTRRFGRRFEVSATPVFAFCKRYAPFLMW